MDKFRSNSIDEKKLNAIIENQRGKPGELLTTLEKAQEAHPLKYLPEETLTEVSRKLHVPYTQVYSVATFYSFFNLQPQGRHTIVVCRGTACHTKGSKALLNGVGQILGFRYPDSDDESFYTTPDNEFTIRTVACFGQCAQSPVVAVDGKIYSFVNEQKLLQILKKLQAAPKVKS
ncbi:MAG: NAD(P)H-dependent oxidoreductase subunit E [Paludibacter sp.]|nr:NAD(P)H-dependent oxidoreductase subunit E [Paludibacter sp.]